MQRISVPGKWQFVGLLSVMATPMTAQTSAPRRTVWEGVYTEAPANRGAMAYGQNCSCCHAFTAEGRTVGGRIFLEEFRAKNRGRSA